jgi:glycosyltransferase involved in cell wall biosynthesis
LHFPYHRLGARIFDAADAVVCVSQAEAALVTRRFSLAPERVSVIPNGVRVDEIRAACPRPVSRRIVMASSRLEPYKQVDKVVGMMTDLDATYLLAISGDGPARSKLEDQIERLSISDRVHLLGRLDRPEYVRWMRSAKVFVTLSTQEAQGIAVLEALAAGAQVVASDIPAHREIAAHAGDAVTLVPPHTSSAQLSGAIRCVATRTEDVEFRPMTWPLVIEKTLEVYARVLDTPTRIANGIAPAFR